jgi:hypothetical protein
MQTYFIGEHIETSPIVDFTDHRKAITRYRKYYFNRFKFNFYNLVRDIYHKKYLFKGHLENLHNVLDVFSEEERTSLLEIPEIGVNDRKSVFVRDYYREIDADDDHKFIGCYKRFIEENIKPLFPGEKIVYQATPNLRFSFPNSTAIGRRTHVDPSPDIIGLHKDADFGHSLDEINIVVPITEMFDTNSIYFETDVESQEYENLNLKQNEFFIGYLNQLRHYNCINATEKTRISLDFRIIPFSKYKEGSHASVTSHKKMVLGDYFDVI